ncbi:protein kinase [Streptomyces sp. V3I7]|uniref:protein kinase n=1 Tax=Streptomyces sp. V3I7 TaxID=3042278 RepID=UPI002788AAF6|nr:protein kinase [Streptomyces sp. V3I7]MDQ0992546.1 serine/threonine protein kinase [Streptomyces sp. V3I7]
MDEYAGRVLADRYRLPLPPSDEYELTETRAFDTYSGQEVLVRQLPLPEVVEAEVLDADGLPDGFTAAHDRGARRTPGAGRSATRRPADPVVRRAVEAAQAAARIPDHPRLDQVFDVFVEGGSLWVASELVAARPLAALLAERPLTPYRAAEVASDVLMALRVLHAHGWVHRNITARTVLVCDDGRVMLTGLAVGAAEEALCGHDPVPGGFAGPGDAEGPGSPGGAAAAGAGSAPGRTGSGAPGAGGSGAGSVGVSGASRGLGAEGAGARGGAAAAGAGGASGRTGSGAPGAGGAGVSGGPGSSRGLDEVDPEAARRAAIQARAAGGLPPAGADGAAATGAQDRRALDGGDDIRAARAGAIAAYREGARAAARVQQTQQNRRAALPGGRPAADEDTGSTPPGQVASPYGVRPPGAWPGQGPVPRTAPGGPPALPPQSGFAAALPEQAPANPPYGGMANAPERNGRWAEGSDGRPGPGPGTALAAERARQVRMTVVGPVTERWAPEQAGPVHENWQLAPPIGPATDLWALGALLFRAVQGHAPYPEESTAELVQLVCAEPPAFAEECGPLRPVVESLLRQDPTERLDVEELRGWLRSLVRSAPEPEAGAYVVSAPPTDTSRLPIVRQRGWLVRRRRAGLPEPSAHGRHKRAPQEPRSPRNLGRALLLLVLLLMAGAIAYAVLFMPKADRGGAAGGGRTSAAGDARQDPSASASASSSAQASAEPSSSPAEQSSSAPSAETQGATVADGFTLRKDPDGFQVAVAHGWDRSPKNGRAQVVYSHGDFELVVVPGRDRAATYGSDPMRYQRDKERELQPYRDSSWATATGLRTIEVGERTMAEGQFTWTDDQGRDLYVRNVAMLIGGRYHVLQVRGPEAERDEVTRLYEQAAATYRFTGST